MGLTRVGIDARMMCASGIGTYLSSLLDEIIPAHPEVNFTCHGDPDQLDACTWSRLAHVRVSPWLAPVYSLSGLISFPRVADAPDAVWFPHYVTPLRIGAPCLITVHDVFPLAMPGLMGGAIRVGIARWLFHRARRKAGQLIFISRFTAAEFTRLVGDPLCPTSIIANGVDEAWSHSSAAPSPHPRPYVIAVGNLKPHKNIPRLLEAMRQLPAGCPTIDLVIVGQRDGFLNADPGIARAALALGERVHFTGRISDQEVRRYVHHAQVLVFPSLYEGFGLPPLEAMAAGTAVIAATIPAVKEVCGDAVRYVDAMDPKAIAIAVAEVITMPEVRSQFIRLGKDRAQQLTWKVAAQATWQALSSLA